MQPPDQRPDISRLTPLIVGAAATIVAIVLLWVVLSVRRDQPFPIDVWWNELMLANRTEPGLVLAWIPGHLGGPVLAAVTAVVIVGTLAHPPLVVGRDHRGRDGCRLHRDRRPSRAAGGPYPPRAVAGRDGPDRVPVGTRGLRDGPGHGARAAVPALALVAARRGVGHLDDVESDVPVGALADGRHRRTVPGGRGRRAGVGQRRDDPPPTGCTGLRNRRRSRPADRPPVRFKDTRERPAQVESWVHARVARGPRARRLPDRARRGPRGARLRRRAAEGAQDPAAGSRAI